MITVLRARPSFIAASTAALMLASPLAAQDDAGNLNSERAPNLVTDQLPVPDVSALPAPSERVGEYADVNGARISIRSEVTARRCSCCTATCHPLPPKPA